MRHFGKEIVPHRVNAEQLYKVVGIDDVTLGFGHLVRSEKQPRVAVNLLGKRLAERHEHNRPIDCVETDNVLSDNVNVCRPVFFIKLTAAVRVIAESSDIV